MFYYVYVLLSKKDGNFYTGYTNNLFARLDAHNAGKVSSTKNQSMLHLLIEFIASNYKDDNM
jgi:putative endonuclease